MLWADFINSYWRDWRTGDRSKDRDKLDEPEWLAEWLEKQQLPAALPVMPAELEQLKQLRGWLWEEVQQLVQGETPDAACWEQLNQYLAEGPVIRRLIPQDGGQAELTLQPLQSHWQQIMAEISASFAAALLEKDYARFRICGNPDCLWVYYDDTRNRSKRYCDDKLCGNLMKVRRFRARKKAAEADDS
ncbi:CGNR zinc finger domain-containing protein [Paenibacillus sp. MMS20-IR301]|uniref:CGNR zinc finger domain-containing protein n=1 Tax=Paenibacillus sp. MMS20-IR301 TaxID=2895946 RepID=UPI0028F08EBA|nr:CGNR zinc finger domain-containing protein [Paenibacillus sp. MMS20-IR301]WNS41096.1 CGNR zinc finger domain-containing protein [Paenibacillus sp. MMS20-IR301]